MNLDTTFKLELAAVLIASLAYCADTKASCNELDITISIGSKHLTTDYNNNYNETNPGVSFECDYYAVGVYANSLYRTSYHAGFILKKAILNGVTLGTNIGWVSGYTPRLILFARPFIQYKHVRIGFIPQVPSTKTEAVLTFELSFSL